jgi:hypothetical protein
MGPLIPIPYYPGYILNLYVQEFMHGAGAVIVAKDPAAISTISASGQTHQEGTEMWGEREQGNSFFMKKRNRITEAGVSGNDEGPATKESMCPTS